MAAIDFLSSSASDEQLARLVRDGDERAFDHLYVRHLDALRRYTGRILRDESAAEDAVQVALMNAYRSLRAGRLPRAVQPWLFRIARNAAFAQCAQHKETLELPSRTIDSQVWRVNHDNGEPRIDLWMSPEYHYLPLRVRVYARKEFGGRHATLNIDEIRVDN